MWAIHFHGGLSSIDLPNTYICIFLMPRTSEEHKGNPSLYYTLENIEFRPLKEHSDRKDYLDSVKQGASARGDNILVEYRVITEKGAPLSCWSAQPLFACAFINSYAQQIMKVEKEGPNGYFERAKFVVNNGLLVRHQLQDLGWNSMEDALNVTPSSGDSKLSKLGKLRKDGKKWIWQEITNEEILALGCSEDITNEWFFF
ncbi:hypothetical protein VKT23_013139 [Stygiomarasmius scandens]|uniref:Uncharacterized protein n=1 Tax=Marasmiellus scandens TaxID=2682957 RepID=A0ABR1J3M7_9AGAR